MDTIEYKNKLISLGLTERQAIVYIKSLEFGTFSVASLAHAINIKRPTCYLVLDELAQKGLVSVIPSAKKIKYKAEPPEVLVKQIETQMITAKKVSNDLLKLYKPKTEGPTLLYFSGQKAIRGIFDDVLKVKNKEYLYIGSGKDVIDMVGKEYIDEWLTERVRKEIIARSIRMKGTEVMEDIYQTNIMRDLRLAPDFIHIAETIFIYDNKVSIISTANENFGFVVENQEFANTMRGLFEALWTVSEERRQ